MKKKILSPFRDLNPPGHAARSPALCHWAIPAPATILMASINESYYFAFAQNIQLAILLEYVEDREVI
jgi:hypothetical protein